MVHHFIPLGIGNRAHGGEESESSRESETDFFSFLFSEMSIAVHKSIWKTETK